MGGDFDCCLMMRSRNAVKDAGRFDGLAHLDNGTVIRQVAALHVLMLHAVVPGSLPRVLVYHPSVCETDSWCQKKQDDV